MTNETYLKEFTVKGIKAYEAFLEILKTQKPKASIVDVAKITGIIFGMKEAFELRDEAKIKEYIDAGKKTYIAQTNDFECGKIEGYVTVMRIMSYDQTTHDMLQTLLTYVKNI